MSDTAPAPATATGAERHPLRAVVLAGGLTFEREVSLSSGTQVWEELVRAGVDAEIRDADSGLLPGLAASPVAPCSAMKTASAGEAARPGSRPESASRISASTPARTSSSQTWVPEERLTSRSKVRPPARTTA